MMSFIRHSQELINFNYQGVTINTFIFNEYCLDVEKDIVLKFIKSESCKKACIRDFIKAKSIIEQQNYLRSAFDSSNLSITDFKNII